MKSFRVAFLPLVSILRLPNPLEHESFGQDFQTCLYLCLVGMCDASDYVVCPKKECPK